MTETRRNWSYQGKVWATKVLTEQIERETRARIEVLLPSGYTYTIKKQEGHFFGRFGKKSDGGEAWGNPGASQTETGALLRMLATLVDGCVFPKCTTSYDLISKSESEE